MIVFNVCYCTLSATQPDVCFTGVWEHVSLCKVILLWNKLKIILLLFIPQKLLFLLIPMLMNFCILIRHFCLFTKTFKWFSFSIWNICLFVLLKREEIHIFHVCSLHYCKDTTSKANILLIFLAPNKLETGGNKQKWLTIVFL